MADGSRLTGSLTLASFDRRLVFFGALAAATLASLLLHVLLFDLLSVAANASNTRFSEAKRMERIIKQTWWLEENGKSAREIDQIKSRFWRGDTIGLVRAELERFIQELIAHHVLKASSVLIDTKATDNKGIALLHAQVKLTGSTAGVLRMLDGLAAGANEVFVTGVMIRFFDEQANAEMVLDAPTIIGSSK